MATRAILLVAALIGCAASPSPPVATEPLKAQPIASEQSRAGDTPESLVAQMLLAKQGPAEREPTSDENADDQDGDGVPNDLDRCPEALEDHQCLYRESNRPECCGAADGCPNLDPDKDGVAWPADACPSEPEYWNGFKDDDGCPDGREVEDAKTIEAAERSQFFKKREISERVRLATCEEPKGTVIVEGDELDIIEKIQFAPGSAELHHAMLPILDEVALVLKGHTQLLWTEIAGHVDTDVPRRTAVMLSLDRARAVFAALVQRGVPPEHIGSTGYGAYCPIVAGGDLANDRVELKIVVTVNGRTDVKRGCAKATQNGLAPPKVGR